MADAATSKPRWYRLTPDRLVLLLLAAEGLLWLSERYQWFAFNRHKGWTALIAVASVGVFFLSMLLWFVFALLFRWRFQFSIRSLLLLTVAVALPCSWLTVAMDAARGQREAVKWFQEASARLDTIGRRTPTARPCGAPGRPDPHGCAPFDGRFSLGRNTNQRRKPRGHRRPAELGATSVCRQAQRCLPRTAPPASAPPGASNSAALESATRGSNTLPAWLDSKSLTSAAPGPRIRGSNTSTD